jgi:dTDP-4-amino-4,6-dideoxygalactose transaminase
MNDIRNFEKLIADFYNAPFAVATDCCTHALELCLRLKKIIKTSCPAQTYLSVPMTLEKLKIEWNFDTNYWYDFYELGDTDIIDAAVFWKENGYIPGKYMCLSFQYKKHLNLGKGGMILLDNSEEADTLRKMSYDGRLLEVPWKDQNIDIYGYHYYMTPETAKLGIEKFQCAKDQEARKWSSEDYLYLPNFKVFKDHG